ncbi:MAG TPA: ABC transporter permease subunit [Kofleriaceae bacterium]|nr:ABC transporter permease subunit [Kofleriaceae bacterium]
MPSATWLLVRDELAGFAKSKVMLVLWVLLPVMAIVGYLALPLNPVVGASGFKLSATAFMAFLMSSLAGTVAALMVAVDIISEKNRKVYELFVIRPIRREALIWAKFIAVFGCVTVACMVALALGIAVDWVRGQPVSGEMLSDILRSVVSLIGVIALSAGVGAFFGVVSKTILVAVILILYVGQNLAIVPMLPVYLGILPQYFWVVMLASAALAALVVWGSGFLFRRTEY